MSEDERRRNMAAAAEARIQQQRSSSTGTTTTDVVTDGANDSFIETKAETTITTESKTETTTTATLSVDHLEKDLECPVCFQLFYRPVTLGCGHTFCQVCLSRAVRHSPQCPLCRLPTALDVDQAKTSNVITTIISKYFPEYVKLREVAEMESRRSSSGGGNSSDHNNNTPARAAPTERRLYLFIGSALVCPTSSFMLNLFEPRYVSMVERMLNNGVRHFGMQSTPESEHGVVLEIEEARRVRWNRFFIKTKCVGRYTGRNTRVEEQIGGSPLYVSTTTTYYDIEEDAAEVAAAPAELAELAEQAAPAPAELPAAPAAPAAAATLTLLELENYSRQLSDDVMQFLNPSELSTIRRRCGDSRGPEHLSFWILSWLRMNGSQPTRRELMFCTSTRERLAACAQHIETNRNAAETNPVDFFDVTGNGVGDGSNMKSGLFELLKIVGFCVIALALFQYFPDLLRRAN